MKRSAVFSPCSSLHLHKYLIGRVKRKKVQLYKTVDRRWRAFCLRNIVERFHHSFMCVVAGPTSCGKTEFVAKFIQHVKQIMTPTPQRIVWCYRERQWRNVPTCHWLQNGVSIIRYWPYDFGTGNSSQKVKHFTWYLHFNPFSYFSLLIFSSFCNAFLQRHVLIW